MKTKILTAKQLDIAAAIINSGGLVAFPTETVYGLGANAFNKKAVLSIFKAKRRPADNPLIVHVSSLKDVKPLVKRVSPKARLLMEQFWPGPLSIVFEKSKLIPDEVTAGLGTVVIRMPSNKIACELIKKAGVPIAAPSANSSGKPSPTKASHVIEDLSGRIDAVIDGGSSRKGMESTVIDVRTTVPTVLRLGSVTLEELEKAIGKVRIAKATDRVRSPGMKYRHYAPKARLILVEGEARAVESRIRQLKTELKGKRLVVLTRAALTPHSLYELLRHTEAEIIIVPSVPEKGMGATVMDRLRRAASEIIKV